MNTINDKLQPLASNSMERADSDTLHCLLSATYFINFILKKNINYNVVLISSNIKSFFTNKGRLCHSDRYKLVSRNFLVFTAY